MNVLATHLLPHRVGLVETEQFVFVVDEHVEVCEKRLTENPAYVGISGLNLSKALDRCERLLDSMGTCLQRVQNGDRSSRIVGG